MNWSLKPWCELTTDELYASCSPLRAEVFVVEQTCPFQDLDGLDRRDGVLHLLGYEEGAAGGYARISGPRHGRRAGRRHRPGGHFTSVARGRAGPQVAR